MFAPIATSQQSHAATRRGPQTADANRARKQRRPYRSALLQLSAFCIDIRRTCNRWSADCPRVVTSSPLDRPAQDRSVQEPVGLPPWLAASLLSLATLRPGAQVATCQACSCCNGRAAALVTTPLVTTPCSCALSQQQSVQVSRPAAAGAALHISTLLPCDGCSARGKARHEQPHRRHSKDAAAELARQAASRSMRRR